MSEEVINPRVGMPHTWIEAVWVVLHRAQDTCVQSEEEWEEVTLAMAWITEALKRDSGHWLRSRQLLGELDQLMTEMYVQNEHLRERNK